MKKQIFSLLVLAGIVSLSSFAQDVTQENAKFRVGDDASWAGVNVDESSWRDIKNTMTWTSQGVKVENGFGWYRYHVTIPKSLLEKSDLKETVDFNMGKIDDADEVYLNGKLIGKTGGFPSDEKGYRSAWSTERIYRVKANSSLIKSALDAQGAACSENYGRAADIGTVEIEAEGFDGHPRFREHMEKHDQTSVDGAKILNVTNNILGQHADRSGLCSEVTDAGLFSPLDVEGFPERSPIRIVLGSNQTKLVFARGRGVNVHDVVVFPRNA